MDQAGIALTEILAARRYTLGLLADVDPADWYRQPAEGVTHIAWQVGHLAVAQNMLTLVRVRGEQPGDERILPPGYPALFGRGSTPSSGAAGYPAPAELLDTLSRVQAAVEEIVPRYSEAQWQETPIGPPHRLFDTKLGGLFWCARHEMLHAGQIGLLKRLLGKPATW